MATGIAPFRRTARFCGLAAAGAGALALAGWIAGARELTAVHASFIPMAPNTALAFVLQGGVLYLKGRSAANRAVAGVAAVTAPFVLALALATLAESVGLVDLHVNHLVLRVDERFGLVPSGAMSPVTAANFAVEAVALLLLTRAGWPRALPVAAVLATVSGLVGAVVVLGYAFGSPLLAGGRVVPVALTTGAAFVLNGCGLVAAAGPDYWPLRPFFAGDVRATLLRAFLPLTLGILLLGGLLAAWGVGGGARHPALVAAALACAGVAAVTAAVARAAGRIAGAIDRAERERRDAEVRYAKLADLDRFKEDLAATIVHDLKNPLAIVTATLSLVESRLEGHVEAARLGEALRDARDATSRALRLVGNLLDVARLEARRVQLRRVPVRVRDLVDEVVASAGRRAGEKDLAIGVDVGPDLRVEADADFLRRILENLLDNALRHAPRGGRVAIAGDRTDGRVRIRVGNTGAPIPPAARARVFDKFERADEEGGRWNAGLGLYFCRLAAEAHGGGVRADQADDFPVVFTVELPV